MTTPISICTCATCGLSWNDARVTSMTPVPGARCPFEWFHGSKELVLSDIPPDWPVQPWTAEHVHLSIEWDRRAYEGMDVLRTELIPLIEQYLDNYKDHEITIAIQLETP